MYVWWENVFRGDTRWEASGVVPWEVGTICRSCFPGTSLLSASISPMFVCFNLNLYVSIYPSNFQLTGCKFLTCFLLQVTSPDEYLNSSLIPRNQLWCNSSFVQCKSSDQNFVVCQNRIVLQSSFSGFIHQNLAGFNWSYNYYSPTSFRIPILIRSK